MWADPQARACTQASDGTSVAAAVREIGDFKASFEWDAHPGVREPSVISSAPSDERRAKWHERCRGPTTFALSFSGWQLTPCSLPTQELIARPEQAADAQRKARCDN